MTGLDDRPLRSRLADRLPLLIGLSLLIGLVELVDLGMRLHSRAVRCRPTLTARDVNTPPPHTGAPWLYPATATTSTVAASNVVWLPGAGA